MLLTDQRGFTPPEIRPAEPTPPNAGSGGHPPSEGGIIELRKRFAALLESVGVVSGRIDALCKRMDAAEDSAAQIVALLEARRPTLRASESADFMGTAQECPGHADDIPDAPTFAAVFMVGLDEVRLYATSEETARNAAYMKGFERLPVRFERWNPETRLWEKYVDVGDHPADDNANAEVKGRYYNEQKEEVK